MATTATVKTLLSLVFLFCFFLTTCGQSVHVNISDKAAVTTIDDHFASVAIDASLFTEAMMWDGLDFKFMQLGVRLPGLPKTQMQYPDAAALELAFVDDDFEPNRTVQSPKVQNLAKALSPSYLRVGGTPGDENTFDPTGQGPTPKNATYTGAMWSDLNMFAEAVGWDLIFGLNVLKRNGTNWDPTNALQLLTYTEQKKFKIAGFELGNEPQYFPGPERGKISGQQLGLDFANLKKILRARPAFSNTLVIGPDSVGIIGAAGKVFTEFFAGEGSKVVDRITCHQYYCYAKTATNTTFLSPNVMQTLVTTINAIYAVTHKASPNTPVWLGETSSCWGGGAPGLSNRYVAGFLWLEKLGMAAKMGIKAVVRQTFYGGNYSLIEKGTFEPYPDYWLTVLYKRLVGNKVLQVSHNGTDTLRLYAHCSNLNNSYKLPNGSVTLFYLNVDEKNFGTLITIEPFKYQRLLLFDLRPSTEFDLTDRDMKLNTVVLKTVNNTLPPMEPLERMGPWVLLKEYTFGFIVIPDADYEICKTQT